MRLGVLQWGLQLLGPGHDDPARAGVGCVPALPSPPPLQRLHLHLSPPLSFYLPEVGGCWKTDGVSPCDGDPHSDVTRYVNFIVNPGLLGTRGSCTSLSATSTTARPTHTFLNGTSGVQAPTRRTSPIAAITSTARHQARRCPGTVACDAYSNPNPQELVQLLPCEGWSQWGFPHPGEGWVGDARQWEMDVGGLVNTHLYFYSSGSAPSIRRWVSMEVGPEVFQPMQTAEWSISHWDITVNASAPPNSESRSQSVRFTRPQPTRSE